MPIPKGRGKLWRKGYESWERITGTNFPMNVSWQVLITMVILGLFNWISEKNIRQLIFSSIKNYGSHQAFRGSKVWTNDNNFPFFCLSAISRKEYQSVLSERWSLSEWMALKFRTIFSLEPFHTITRWYFTFQIFNFLNKIFSTRVRWYSNI